jgi:hypothetical protein
VRRNLTIAVAAAALISLMVACSDNSATQQTARDNAGEEQARINEGVGRIHDSQQIPTFDYSQEYQTLLDVLAIRAEGTHGTVIATALDGSLLWWCPSLGAPVPSTYQVTGTTQYIDVAKDDTKQKFPFDLAEPTGVYPGDSAATWALCLDDAGTPFAMYEEANVRWTSGVVNGLDADRRAQVDEITFEFTQAPE